MRERVAHVARALMNKERQTILRNAMREVMTDKFSRRLAFAWMVIKGVKRK